MIPQAGNRLAWLGLACARTDPEDSPLDPVRILRAELGRRHLARPTERGPISQAVRAFSAVAMVALATLPAGCGGGRPAAPSPAPAPVRLQSVEIALGQSGSTLTLMTVGDGRFTRDGEQFRGGRVQARNGNWYELTLADGEWLATFVPPEPVVLALGQTGTALTLQRLENLSWRVSNGGLEATVESGDLVRTEAGASYRLVLADGRWTATFEPMRAEVTLGDSRSSVNLEQGPDGSWRLGDVIVPNGHIVTTALGTTYRLELADGRWSASFEAMQAMVPLGESNASVVLEQGEDGSWRLGENIVQSGHRVTTDEGTTYRLIWDSGQWAAIFDPRRIVIQLGSSGTSVTATQAQDGSYRLADAILAEGLIHRVESTGATYVISMAEGGGWTASYRPAEQTLRLGGASLVTLVRSEDGTWRLDGQPVDNGQLVTTETGDFYWLELAGNTWTATFLPATIPIQGTGLVAVSTEGGRGYRIGESAILHASGEGDVEVDGALYHVWREDGDLHGARFDLLPQGGTAVDGNFKIHLDQVARLSRDRRDTPANEDRTELEVAGTAFPLGELLGTGRASVAGEGITEKAHGRIAALRRQAEVLTDVFEDDFLTLNEMLREIWAKAQHEVNTIFGRGEVELRRVGPATTVVGGLQAVEDALSSEAAFVDATSQGGGGLFEAVALEPGEAAKVFAAKKWNATAVLGALGGTRFGAVRRMVRPDGVAANRLELDAERAAFGAFAYSTLPETPATSRIPHFGTARYAGGVAAVSGDGTFYSGDIELLASFSRLEVGGQISNLTDERGSPWKHQLSPVDRIVLPGGRLRPAGNWAEPSRPEAGGLIEYASTFGTGLAVEAKFRGQFRGTGEAAASEAVGVWSVGEELLSNNYLAGSFGAMRSDGSPGTAQAELGDAISAPTPGPLSAPVRDGTEGGPPALSMATADRVTGESASRPIRTDYARFGAWRGPGGTLAPASDIRGLDPPAPSPLAGAGAPGAVPTRGAVGATGLAAGQGGIEPAGKLAGRSRSARALESVFRKAGQTDR